MKTICLFVTAFMIWAMCIPSPSGHIDTTHTDSIRHAASLTIKRHKIAYEKVRSMLDTICAIRACNGSPVVKIRRVPVPVRSVTTFTEVDSIPVYKKVVYSIYTPRGYHVANDTIEINEDKKY